LVANISKTYFVTADDSPVNFDEENPVAFPGHADYEAVKKMQGFCYYIVEKDGKPTLTKNSKYKKIPEIEIISVNEYPLKKE
jgi:oxalate decarboxylase/phosphoglucose isomerase-like protein (cupin superfamily)